MKTDIHFESEHKVYIGDTVVGYMRADDHDDGQGFAYNFYPDTLDIDNLNSDELRAIASKLDELNGVDKKRDTGWVAWSGVCDMGPQARSDTNVEVLFRDGTTMSGRVMEFRWGHEDHQEDITAYRILEN